MVRDLGEGLEKAKFEGWLMPVNQLWSPHLGFPSCPSSSFATVKDYEDYVTRLKQCRPSSRRSRN